MGLFSKKPRMDAATQQSIQRLALAVEKSGGAFAEAMPSMLAGGWDWGDLDIPTAHSVWMGSCWVFFCMNSGAPTEAQLGVLEPMAHITDQSELEGIMEGGTNLLFGPPIAAAKGDAKLGRSTVMEMFTYAEIIAESLMSLRPGGPTADDRAMLAKWTSVRDDAILNAAGWFDDQ